MVPYWYFKLADIDPVVLRLTVWGCVCACPSRQSPEWCVWSANPGATCCWWASAAQDARACPRWPPPSAPTRCSRWRSPNSTARWSSGKVRLGEGRCYLRPRWHTMCHTAAISHFNSRELNVLRTALALLRGWSCWCPRLPEIKITLTDRFQRDRPLIW